MGEGYSVSAMTGDPQTPANWYPDPQNPAMLRWWDGQQWTDRTQPAQTTTETPVIQPTIIVQNTQAVRQENNTAMVYTRQQKGHSLLLHILLIGPFCLWINCIYITASPNHYWHI